MNVLVIEDDHRIANLLQIGLTDNGHHVSVSGNGRDGAALMLNQRFDAVLLDILLPGGMDGLAVLEHVREKRCMSPVMVVTAVDTVPSVLRAFDIGADDYLVKPFMLEILLARLDAISRRGKSDHPPLLEVGSLVLDRSRRTVTREGLPIHLTRKQFDLLELLMRRRGLLTSRNDLIEAGWGYLADVKPATLDVYIHGLRTKLGMDGSAAGMKIRTVHGSGYMLVAG